MPKCAVSRSLDAFVTVVTSTCNGSAIALRLSMSSLSGPDGCVECASLLGHYEALTFEQARVHNSLDIAKLLCDRASTRRLTISAYSITATRDAARKAFTRHQAAVHDFSVAA